MTRPFILGLTGSIGMGKSTTAAMFARRGIPLHDADAAVRRLYAASGAGARLITDLFPDAIAEDGSVDRARLRDHVLGRPDSLARLEAAIHPLVRAEEQRFLDEHADASLVILDIPLLFETSGEARCDAVLVVTADPDVQRQRVLARPGMSEAAFAAILAKQMPDADKRARADFLIDTGLGLAGAENQVDALIERLVGAGQA
ncbi:MULTISPECIES: dephospho-CoA kinase [unclassified Methylobacterium]|uniref:dephospho-CoA kinase n=1 Tax=unclassified Methylobacterium TaxID=2615210 RepID=UPI0006F689BA|nr:MULTISPECIES: dephospho-CoA kinase [unclassified Methylobacterium]KQO49067.1 dephospho-CoA kinase [Methylobacterium sp. Leaf86]KQP00700.1 dephospho-CoA kinase [Methylobacterium sp. Leaf91]